MTVNEIMKLELMGLQKTMEDYCRENYVLSYMDQLKGMTYPDDLLYIKQLAERILEWYENNIDNIRESRFISNKLEHEKSVLILRELVGLLQQEC